MRESHAAANACGAGPGKDSFQKRIRIQIALAWRPKLAQSQCLSSKTTYTAFCQGSTSPSLQDRTQLTPLEIPYGGLSLFYLVPTLRVGTQPGRSTANPPHVTTVAQFARPVGYLQLRLNGRITSVR